MYSNLLEHYATNSARTNHYILSFMLRLSTFKVRITQSPNHKPKVPFCLTWLDAAGFSQLSTAAWRQDLNVRVKAMETDGAHVF